MDKNNTILIEWKGILFSENIFAYFKYDVPAVFSNRIEDLLLSDNYVIQKHESSGSYEIFEWDEECRQHLYTGRLFAPKGVELM